MQLSTTEIKEKLIEFYPILKSKDVETLLSISSYQEFKSKEIILKRGRKDKKFLLILSGSVRSYSFVKGEEHNCHLRSEGKLMGDARLFGDDQTALLDTEAITDSQVLIFDMGDLEKQARNDVNIMDLYLGFMKEIIVVFSHRIHTFVTMDATERHADLMKWNPLYLKSTYDKHLASFLGITPLTFHRVKNK